jgi:hypothetical protein
MQQQFLAAESQQSKSKVVKSKSAKQKQEDEWEDQVAHWPLFS